jgi:hypothetical protein
MDVPAVIIHSRDDEIIPFRQALKNREAAKNLQAFLEMTGGHNSGFSLDVDRYIDFLHGEKRKF